MSQSTRAQSFDAFGNKLGGEILTARGGRRGEPHGAMDGGGNWAVV